jgi:hypothetical protein
MWRKRQRKSPRLPLGVQIVYVEGDEEELLHILNFLRSYFVFTEEDFSEDVVDTDELNFPYVWVSMKKVPFKRLLKVFEPGKIIGDQINIGFHHEHQPIFRAYREHCNQDGACEESLKKFFAEVEKDYFGTPSSVH